jgi:predicted nucleic acid-binding protein
MTVAILDTTFFVQFLRGNQAAKDWLQEQQKEAIPSITPFTWMVVTVGGTNKATLAVTLDLLMYFPMVYPMPKDLDWAMRQMAMLRLSHGVTTIDWFNASVCHGLQVPILTHNVKDYLKMLPPPLVIQPYAW